MEKSLSIGSAGMEVDDLLKKYQINPKSLEKDQIFQIQRTINLDSKFKQKEAKKARNSGTIPAGSTIYDSDG